MSGAGPRSLHIFHRRSNRSVSTRQVLTVCHFLKGSTEPSRPPPPLSQVDVGQAQSAVTAARVTKTRIEVLASRADPMGAGMVDRRLVRCGMIAADPAEGGGVAAGPRESSSSKLFKLHMPRCLTGPSWYPKPPPPSPLSAGTR